jgi:hypothetical protein
MSKLPKPLLPGPEDQRRRITVEEAEARYFESRKGMAKREPDEKRRKQLQLPMGFNNDNWERLKRMIEPGDELWEYCTSKRSWNELTGSAGFELIRNGEVIAEIVNKMN